jgi:hypothetical protein
MVSFLKDPDSRATCLVLRILLDLATGARAHAPPGCEGKFRLGWQMVKSCPPTVIETEKRTRGLLSGIVLFRLMVSPLQPGVVAPYSIWGIRFVSRVSL